MPEKESFDIDGLMVFEGNYTAKDQDGNIVPSVITPDRYKQKDREPLSSEQTGRYTNTTAYWKDHSDIVPAKGDMYIYSDGGTIEQGGVTINVPKIKIGDGVTTIDNLPFTDSDNQGGGEAGTLDTTNTSAQTPSASESLSGNVNLHKVAKTGSYEDLNNKPTIPTNIDDLDDVFFTTLKDYDTLLYSELYGQWENQQLSTVAITGNYDSLKNKPTIPTVNDAVLTIQKNGTTVDTFSANASQNKTINITVPATASDVGALSSSTKYGASLSLSVDSSTYVVTAQLKDQDGNNLGSAQTIDLPLESVVVSGSYNAQTKKVVLTLQNGSTIEFSVADLVAGLQSEITAQNPLSADLVTDGTTNKVLTSAEKTKLAGIEAGAEVNVQSDWNQSDNTKDDFIKNKPTLATVATSGSYSDLSDKPTIPAAQVNADWNASSGAAEILHKPTIPSNTSDLNNDSGFITLSDVPAQVNADWTETDTTSDAYILHKPELFSGDYDDLTNKPTIPTVPTNVSAFTNDAGYLTQETDPVFSAWDKDYDDLTNTPVGGNGIELKSLVNDDYNVITWASNESSTYINTEIAMSQDDIEMELVVKPTIGSWYMWQTRPSGGSTTGISGSSTNDTITFAFCGTTLTSGLRRYANPAYKYLVRAKAKNGNMSLYVKRLDTGVDDTKTGTYTYTQQTLPLYMFGNQRGDRVTRSNRIYSAKMWLGGKLVLDYVPVMRKSDDTIMFFDTRTQSFITPNSGSLYKAQEDYLLPTPLAINAVAKGITIYSGSSAPASVTGADGDIYIQEVV